MSYDLRTDNRTHIIRPTFKLGLHEYSFMFVTFTLNRFRKFLYFGNLDLLILVGLRKIRVPGKT